LTTPASVPGAPGITAQAVYAKGQIELAWTPADQTALAYSIERQSGGGGFVQIATVSAPNTAYSDTNPPAQVTVQYRIQAINAVGFSPYSNSASALSPLGVDASDGFPYYIDIALGLDPTASNPGALPASPFPITPPGPPAPDPSDLTPPVITIVTPAQATLL
jgi:hypothetical protein